MDEESPRDAAASAAVATEARTSSPSPSSRVAAYFQELGRRVVDECRVELPLVKRHWWVILLCLLFQYVHGVFTQLSYVLARPEPEPLPDLGFAILPELPTTADWASESLFYSQFFIGIAWLVLSPFFSPARRLNHTATGLASAALPALVLAQCLRVASFSSTRLPSPAPHCLSSSPVAVKPKPQHWWQYIAINVVTQASKSCGDLIFSSHLTFALSFCILYTLRGNFLILKIIWWVAAVALSLLIIASRKHYSVDVVVAWYAVPLIFYAVSKGERWKRIAGRPAEAQGGERRDVLSLQKQREEEEKGRRSEGGRGSGSPSLENGTAPSELTEVRVVGGGGGGR